MIPMSAWTLTVFSILGFSFSRDHQKESARALKMVRQTLTRERFPNHVELVERVHVGV